ncbi:MAG: hypothetical protein Unbinned2072contig1001_33 [Prokaryotic dsDNA virus sp.]|nr:MAG: hypothetical protein Unbinned2072contig1001_33 [Prokaryotic dsDNA virus sp.]|tara:strand:+ start:6272 stop:7666 length:1395 start_codon:yes stop_codon:yes gene_type:complete
MGLKDTANFANIPAAYKSGKIYSILPITSGFGQYGDLTYSGPLQSRQNSSGSVVSSVANLPALNYHIVDGEVVGFPELQMAKNRTNFFKYSEYLNANWSAVGLTANLNSTNIINVNGNFGATKFMENTTNNSHNISQSVNLLSNRTYFFSIYVKPIDRVGFRVSSAGFVAGSTTNNSVEFDLDTFNIDKFDSSSSVARIQKLPNNWYRCSCQFTANSSGGFSNIVIEVASRNTNGSLDYSYTGDVNKGLALYGAQLEANPNSSATEPSPYIVTDGNIVTRANATIQSGASTQSKEIFDRGYPVTLYWEGKIDRYATKQHAYSLLNVDSGSSGTDYLSLDFNSDTIIRIRRANSSPSFTEYIGSVSYRTTKKDYLKIVVVFKNTTDYAIYINGFFIQSFSGSAINWNFNGLRLGCGLASNNDASQRQSYNQFFFWARGFTDAEASEVSSYNSYNEMATSSNFKLG